MNLRKEVERERERRERRPEKKNSSFFSHRRGPSVLIYQQSPDSDRVPRVERTGEQDQRVARQGPVSRRRGRMGRGALSLFGDRVGERDGDDAGDARGHRQRPPGCRRLAQEQHCERVREQRRRRREDRVGGHGGAREGRVERQLRAEPERRDGERRQGDGALVGR